MSGQSILIAGGYGVVGGRIAAELAPEYPGRVVVAGRHVDRADAAAATIETSLLLSARDLTGPASFDYFLNEVAMTFDVHEHGADRRTRAFTHPRVVEFPPPITLHRAYLFPFSDQVLYPTTMGVQTAVSRLALDPSSIERLLAILVKTRVAPLLSREPLRRTLARLRGKRTTNNDAQFALRVDVTNDHRSSSATLTGPAQADAAAAGAACLVRSLVDGEVDKPGAWMPEQVIDPSRYFARLARSGLTVEGTPSPLG